MKFNKVGQVALVSAIALTLASTFTACNPVTIDYLFVAGQRANSNGQGQIQSFLVDRVSGALNPVNSTVASGGVTPVSEAVSTDYTSLYVANQGDSSLVQFSIASNGVLKAANTISLSSEGNTPVAIAMNTDGTLLFVVNKYQPGCTTTTINNGTCPGALAVFPVGTNGALGTPAANGSLNYWPVGVNPTAVNALGGGTAVYVSSYDPTAGLGYLYGFNSGSGGALTAVSGSPFDAGVKPVGITSTPTSRFVYVTDFAQNELIAYSVLDGGVLHPLINGPFKTGNQPSAITIDPRGIYLYVTNELDNTVSAYEIAVQTGTPSAAVNTTGSATNNTSTEPVAVLVDAAFGRFVYAANFLDNSVSGFQLNPSTGTLAPAQSTPFPSVGAPVALASVPHGNHSINVVQP
jgi:6-phosphogluconolactonase